MSGEQENPRTQHKREGKGVDLPWFHDIVERHPHPSGHGSTQHQSYPHERSGSHEGRKSTADQHPVETPQTLKTLTLGQPEYKSRKGRHHNAQQRTPGNITRVRCITTPENSYQEQRARPAVTLKHHLSHTAEQTAHHFEREDVAQVRFDQTIYFCHYRFSLFVRCIISTETPRAAVGHTPHGEPGRTPREHMP